MPGRQLIMTFPVTATSHTLADYRARGGYQALPKALAMAPQDVTKEVTAAGLLGHGGAAFPVGRKWAVVRLDDGQPHFLCCNADEGEPGTFKDRWILEHAPHLLIESMLIAAHALQVRHAFVYIRGEFDLPYRRLAGAIEEAYDGGLLGKGVLGAAFDCDINVIRGAGSYVCGEASGLLASVEGKRGYPRNRPPRLTVKGLRSRVRLSAREVPVRRLRRDRRRQEAQMHHPRRRLDQSADGGRMRVAHLRQAIARKRRIVDRIGRHDRHRRRHVHGAAPPGDAALLPP